MIVVVDTNVLFSACLTPAGKIFEILFHLPSSLQLISCRYAIEELMNHKDKLVRLSKHSPLEVDTPFIAKMNSSIIFY